MLYEYLAKVVNIYDGDTMTLDVDLGFGVWLAKQKVRLLGIDTPEIRGNERADGVFVRDYLRALLPVGETVKIQTFKSSNKGKYGRWLAVVYMQMQNEWLNINEHLLDQGMAKIYE
jgi:micrococcal nuclease